MRKMSLELICDHCGKNILNEKNTNMDGFALQECLEVYKCVFKFFGEKTIVKDLCLDCRHELIKLINKSEVEEN
jgi:hypothetical protein